MDRFYFDHNATTPVAPHVLEAMTAALRDLYGNASSIHHFGQVARQALESARRQVAALLNADPRGVVFTSGGTESNNIAILGTVRAAQGPRKHVITSAIEHPAVLAACAQLEREGVDVTYVRVSAAGVVDPADVRSALRPDTVLISVMHANNETGAVQPVREIAAIARGAGVPFHSDGVQAAGKLQVDVAALGVDFYSLSAHKLYAPKGIGAVYVRPGAPFGPLLFGGRHERGRRAGTENVPGALAFGCAAETTAPSPSQFETEPRPQGSGCTRLRDRLERGILERVPDVTVNGAGAPRVGNTTNLCFHGIEGEAMVIALDLKGFAVSSGSACSSGAVEPSHVLIALGLSPEDARASVRFSLGAGNTEEQVDALIDAVAESAARLRKLSPTYNHA